jgi:hypothetical protein
MRICWNTTPPYRREELAMRQFLIANNYLCGPWKLLLHSVKSMDKSLLCSGGAVVQLWEIEYCGEMSCPVWSE